MPPTTTTSEATVRPHKNVATVRPLLRTWRRLRRNPAAVISLLVLIGIIVISVLADFVAPYDPLRVELGRNLRPPSIEHFFGTDAFGRDIFSRILYGAQVSLVTGALAVVISNVIGVPLGMLAGFFGGTSDRVISRFTDLLLAFPGLLLALVVVSILGPGLVNTMIAVGIAQAPERIRLVRGAVLAAKEEVYVEATRALGGRTGSIMWRHIFPNVLSPLIVVNTLGIASAILAAAALSFIGLGAQPPEPEWGSMLSEGRRFMRNAWWISVFPGLAIMLTVVVINIMGDALRDVLDPTAAR